MRMPALALPLLLLPTLAHSQTCTSWNDSWAADDVVSTNEDTATLADVLANDVSPSTARVVQVSTPGHGVVANYGSFVGYAPAKDFAGWDGFTYVSYYSWGGCSWSNVYVWVAPVNDPPVPQDDFVGTMEGSPVSIAVLTNDVDVDSSIAIASVSAPNKGSVAVKGSSIVYTPSARRTGWDLFTYTVSDGQYARSANVGVWIQPERLYANMPFVIDYASGNFSSGVTHIDDDSNAIDLHLDFFGIPWYEFATGQPLPSAWVAEMDKLANASAGLPVYLSLTPMNGSRDRLAPYARQTTSGLLYQDDAFSAPCSAYSTRADWDLIQRGFHAYTEWAVARFHPQYLAVGIEVNLYPHGCGATNAGWTDVKSLLESEYRTQKAEHPSLPVFDTFQVDALWDADGSAPCHGYSRSCLGPNLAALSGLDYDLFAISSYPAGVVASNGWTMPDDYLTVFHSLTGKTLAVGETGFPPATFREDVGGTCYDALPSNPQAQQWWVDKVLADADAQSMPFVTWWLDTDPISLATMSPCHCTDPSAGCQWLSARPVELQTMMRWFGMMGLRDDDGTPMPALADWRARSGKD